MGIELQTSPRPFKNLSNSLKSQIRGKKSKQQQAYFENGTPRAFVIESEGLSVVPYFQKSSFPRDARKFQWSINKLTNQRTITRKENYANGRWSEVPANLVLPHPPISWLTPRPEFEEEEISMTSTKVLPDSLQLLDDSSNDSSSSFNKQSCAESASDSGYCELEN